ncbi:MAG: HIRAN domain-containing protein [Betaproteobacteria bacterium]|nr:HIRAN domain-containing protein [Betaproteobacteria bacterium]MBI2510084.1 HIRAN domain-containing protein [Betaproteobacteria bacterium]
MTPARSVFAALGLAATLHSLPAPAAEALIVVQRSPLAGFRHYDGPEVWQEMKVGDRLELTRESDNPYDAGAIRVAWRGRKLGYVPRRDNAAVARQMDRGAALEARITGLKESRNRRVRIEFEVVVPLASQGNSE